MDEKSILMVLEDLGITDISVHERNIQIPCFFAKWRPGHNAYSDHSGSMGISINDEESSAVHCFSCNWGSTLEEAVMMLGRYEKSKDFSEVLVRIREIEEKDPVQIANSVAEYDEPLFEKIKRPHLGECLLRMFCIPGTHPYLLDRGFTIETLKKWECHFDTVRQRTVFPIREKLFGAERKCQRGLVGAVGRTVIGSSIKYFNYFQFNKSECLYGVHLSKGSKSVVVVEGLLDTLAVWQSLVFVENAPDVVGLLGAMASRKQISRLAKSWDEVILFLDDDPAGWTGQLHLVKGLGRQVLVKGVQYPRGQGTDPASLMSQGVDVGRLLKNSDLLVY